MTAPALSPEELRACLALLERLRDAAPDDPARVEVERAADHLRKSAKRRRRLLRKQKRRCEDLELLGRSQPFLESGVRSDPEEEFLGRLGRSRACYACKRPYREVHARYPGMCASCAELNLERRSARADLRGRRALVTGGRIKIGYETALKLLRDGAAVTVTTRFPRDAARRFAAEPDFEEWRERLVLAGLDLLDLPSVLRFANALVAEGTPLDVLVNNAAQTIRRPRAYHAALIAAEHEAWPPRLENLRVATPIPAGLVAPSPFFPPGLVDAFGEQLDLRPENSWTGTLADLDPAELLEVHLVNAVAPALLCARLKPLLLRSAFPARFIVNVSAMEGQFGRATKTFRHPHTNMAKAALNMLTRTAAADYARDGIHMVSVDTGWVTDENPVPRHPERDAAGFRTPLDVVDGAARVYDPVVRGVRGDPVHGIFLKDYHPHEW
jgi:NAD(P)-dependent dehydrogenase (short-subunit alcohol dehydrogenase family)